MTANTIALSIAALPRAAATLLGIALALAPAAASAASPTDQDTGQVQLSPYHLVLPPAPAGASPAEATFLDAAAAAVEAVYLRDTDDGTALARLQADLQSNPALAGLRTAWGDILAAAAARAESLRALAPALLALREGAGRATFDPETGELHRVQAGACGRAFAPGPATSPAAASVVVAVGHLGRRPLGEWRALCEANRERALADRQLPGRRAPAWLEAWAQRQYRAHHLAGRLVRLHVVGRLPGHSRPGRLVAGIVRPAGPGEEPCAMRTLLVDAAPHGTLRPLGRAVPMLCRALVLPAALR